MGTRTPPDCGGTAPAQPFDYMSYCARDDNAWISGIGWNEIIDKYNYGVQRRAATAALRRILARPAARRPGIRVKGWVQADGGHLGSVTPGSFASAHGPGDSPVTIQGVDASGHVTSSVKAQVQMDHSDGPQPSPVLVYDATLPGASAKGIRVVDGGQVVAGRDRSAHAPKASFISPRKNATVGRRRTVVVKWRASDADKGNGSLDVALDYSANGGGTWHRIYEGPDTRKGVKLPAAYFSHAKRARLRLAVDDGFNVTRVRSPIFRSLGVRPVVRISRPVRGSAGVQNAVVLMSGIAYDDADKSLSGKRLTWREGARVLGHGENIGVPGLAAGRQTITLEARDSSGRVGRATTTVRLTAVAPKFRKVSAPKRVSRRAKSVTLRLSTSVESTVRIGTQRFRAWSTARGLKVKVKPGRSKLKLKVRIASGKYSATRTVTITRK